MKPATNQNLSTKNCDFSEFRYNASALAKVMRTVELWIAIDE